MKVLQIFLIFFFTVPLFSGYCQNVSDKSLIIYKTFEDFMSNNETDAGKIITFTNDNWGMNKIIVKQGDSKEKININHYWGFKIDDYIFRMNKDMISLPVIVIKKDEKVFYADGYLYLSKIIFDEDGGSSFRESDGCFYSDNLNSEIFEITKIIKKEKNNPKLKDLIECIKKAKKRYGVQSKFNGYSECLK